MKKLQALPGGRWVSYTDALVLHEVERGAVGNPPWMVAIAIEDATGVPWLIPISDTDKAHVWDDGQSLPINDTIYRVANGQLYRRVYVPADLDGLCHAVYGSGKWTITGRCQNCDSEIAITMNAANDASLIRAMSIKCKHCGDTNRVTPR